MQRCLVITTDASSSQTMTLVRILYNLYNFVRSGPQTDSYLLQIDITDRTSPVSEFSRRTHSRLRSLDEPQLLDERTHGEVIREIDAHAGVVQVEATEKVYTPTSMWILFVSLGMASYVYALDSSTTSNYLSFAASAFGEHSLISTVGVAQSVFVAVGKPVIAKVADVTSRAYAYSGVLVFYMIGYIVIAGSNGIGTFFAGIIFYAIGLQLLTQIVIADLTTLKWRALVSSLTSLPFIINGFIGPNIANAVLERANWRVGYGMFAVIVPATLLPLILTLFWAERKAKRLGMVDEVLAAEGVMREALVSEPRGSFIGRMHHYAEQLDLVGLILLGGAVGLILLPLSLAKNGKYTPSIISLLVVGCVLLCLFAIWDLRHASRPVIAPRFLRNRTVVIASLIGCFDFLSYFLTFVYLYSFVLVVKPWTQLEATYFLQVQTIALTICGFCAGVIMFRVRRCKLILISGLCIRLLGCGLMIHSRGAKGSTVEIVMTQVLQGLGGGFAAVANQVAGQASVPHVDLAIVTAVLLLMTEIGGGIGNAMAGAMWRSTMPRNLEKELPQLSEAERKALFGSITDVLRYPRGDPIREGVIAAYDETMKGMVIIATILSVVPIILSLGMPNWYLGETQNAVDDSAFDDELYDHDSSRNSLLSS
ncbi:hypothetical protein ACEPAH_8522 [Sanghuangporus vaninii]